jgi:hypothetical protein
MQATNSQGVMETITITTITIMETTTIMDTTTEGRLQDH